MTETGMVEFSKSNLEPENLYKNITSKVKAIENTVLKCANGFSIFVLQNLVKFGLKKKKDNEKRILRIFYLKGRQLMLN